MIKKVILDKNLGKYELIVEGINREFIILIGGSDLYFCLSDYEKGGTVTIPNDDKNTYEILNKLLLRIKTSDDKCAPLFKNSVFEWISDSGIPEECNRLKIYQGNESIVFDFWRNDIKPYRNCNISFCTSGAVSQSIVNELMYFFNSYTEKPEGSDKQMILKK